MASKKAVACKHSRSWRSMVYSGNILYRAVTRLRCADCLAFLDEVPAKPETRGKKK